MRTTTDLDTALLTSPGQTYRVWLKVEMTRASAVSWGGETWVDLTDLNGFDWVIGAEYGESIDSPAWTATVRLHSHLTDNALFSLSPFLTSSINNSGGVLIQPYRKVRISTAVVPDGDPKASATFNVVFQGRIDSWSMTNGEIVVECRDRTAELQDFFVEEEATYGDVDPTTATAADVEEIIQNILDDHYNTNTTVSGTASAPRANPLSTRTTDGSPFQLYSSNGTSTTPFNTSTGFAIRQYNQTKMPVWDSISRLADLIGYQLRMRWHEGTGIDDFVLTLEEPDRTKSTADISLDPTLGQANIRQVQLTNQDVRNVVRVSYSEEGTRRQQSESNNSASITKYGRRFMEIQESSTSQIDTSTEADKMRDGFLNDLKEPTVMVELVTSYLWYAQINDLVSIAADNFFFDSEQKVAILSRRNTIQQGGPAITALVCQGLPKNGVVKHVEKHRTFQSPMPDLQLPSSPGLVHNGDFTLTTDG